MRILGVDPGSRTLGYAVVEIASELPRGHKGARGQNQDVSDPAARLRTHVPVALGPGTVRYLECGVVTADVTAALEVRLAEIAVGVREVIAELRPDVVAAEDVFVAGNARTALALGQARGAALVVAGEAGLRVFAYAPALVKRAVTGRGRASKDQVGRMVAALLGLRARPRVDAADALAVAVTHALIGGRADPARGRA